jgi:aspartyl-tRNA(Asn)/glutamyl-tRNA(Gln) amidotransferase subunit A
MSSARPTLGELSAALSKGDVSSAELVAQSIASIDDPDGEGARAFIKVDADGARAQAEVLDRLREKDLAPTPYAGIPIAVKDLFDVRDQITTAGSKVLADQPAAQRDCPPVARLRDAGFVILGRTNMTEFAYSGLGVNPHYGTPSNPYDRATGRIPGGSSSGTGVAVADGMVAAGLGTDTGGSCRIPAAFCGVVGFKPTANRIPRDGVYPLARSFDSVGPLATTVACCAVLDAVMSTDPQFVPPATAAQDIKLAALGNYVLEDMDGGVTENYLQTLDYLRRRGVSIIDFKLPALEAIPGLYANGGILGAEAFAVHRPRLAESAQDYDPRVSTRIARGSALSAADYVDLVAARENMINIANAATADYDAVLMPTVPICAPTFSDVESEEGYQRLNPLVLRNPSVGNFLDRCAISLPIHESGSAPVGLMLMGETGGDRKLLSIAQAVEALLKER